MLKNMPQRTGISTNYMNFDVNDPRQYIFGSASEYILEETKSKPKFVIDVNDTNNRVQNTMFLKSEDYCNQEQQNIASPTMGEYLKRPQTELVGNLIGCKSYPNSDPYDVGMISSYGPHNLVQYDTAGRCPTKKALPAMPLEVAEEPVYVNPKQYRGILRRRQSRAKAELEKKPTKCRKQPYLHESRHLHAMRRARGSGGRFLNTKKLETPSFNDKSRKSTNYNDMGKSAYFSSNNDESFLCKEVRDEEGVQRFQDYNINANSQHNMYQRRPESSMFYSFLHQRAG